MGKTIDGNGTTTTFDVKGDKGEAMLFVPVSVHIDQAPLMVFFHGHSNHDKPNPQTLADYLGDLPDRDFRPLLKLKKVVLIEPWGGTWSRFGTPATAAGLPALIEGAIGTTRPASLILVGFSGGGDALSAVGRNLGGTWFSLLSEVWCLDCMYSGEGDDWGNWARKNKKRLRVGLSSGEDSRPGKGPRSQVKAIGTGDSITIENFDCGHEELPGRCITKWLTSP